MDGRMQGLELVWKQKASLRPIPAQQDDACERLGGVQMGRMRGRQLCIQVQ